MPEGFEKFSCNDSGFRWRGFIRRGETGITAVCLKLDEPGIRLFHDSRKIKAGEVDGLFVKSYNLPGTLTQIRRFFKPSRLDIVMRGAAHLESLQIPTPRVLAALTAWNGWRRREYLVTSFLRRDDRPMNTVFDSQSPDETWRLLLEIFIPMLARLHDSGALHGDLNLRNLFLSAEGEAGLIDLDGMKLSSAPLDCGGRAREIARLVSSFITRSRRPDDAAEYAAAAIKSYAGSTGCVPDMQTVLRKTEIFIHRAKKYL